LVPRHVLRDTPVTVIGVGAGGRNTALQLAAIGAPELQIIDFDIVDLPNITTQGYCLGDIGRPKVEVLAETIASMTNDCEVDAVCDRFRPTMDIHDVVFCCVDKIEDRQRIWEQIGTRTSFWCDGRMLGETIRIIVAADDKGRLHYPTTLFAEEEANTGRCTAQSTIYAANIAAGMAVHQFTRWLRGIPCDHDVTFSLLAGDIFAT
jgi:hypothetical protein